MSVAFGSASGVLLGAITLEMVPQALELTPLWLVAVGFANGFLAVWLFDLFVNRWEMAGEHAAQPSPHPHHRHTGARVDQDPVDVPAAVDLLPPLVAHIDGPQAPHPRRSTTGRQPVLRSEESPTFGPEPDKAVRIAPMR